MNTGTEQMKLLLCSISKPEFSKLGGSWICKLSDIREQTTNRLRSRSTSVLHQLVAGSGNDTEWRRSCQNRNLLSESDVDD